MKSVSLIATVFLSILIHRHSTAQENEFKWPDHKTMAISLTWDDGRASQVDIGTAILNKYGIKATFYVLPSAVEKSLDSWKQAVADGHEIGNHSLNHPCSGNFLWARDKALEEKELDDIQQELLTANSRLKEMLGVDATEFAYPCGQTFVGGFVGVPEERELD